MFASESFNDLPNEPAVLPNSQDFDYAALEDNTRLFVQERTKDIKEHEHRLKQAAWEIGRNLIEVRECLTPLGYGLFTSWLRIEFQWSKRTAYNYIAIYQSFPSCATVAQLGITISSLYLLASPSTPEEARLEVRQLAEKGREITPKEVKAVVARHKQPTKPRVVEQITVKAEAETVERELPVVTPIQHVYTQPDRQEVLDATFIEFDEKEPTRYATPQPLGIVGNHAVEEKNQPGLVEKELVTEVELGESSFQIPMEIFETSTDFSPSEENNESREVAMSIEQDQPDQELDETLEISNPQTALEKIYSFLISQTKEYLPNFPNVKFSEVDKVIKQIAQDTNFRVLTKSGQLGQEQLEEVQQAFEP